ncbi:Ig-like domain-containing protein [uncultured Methanobrevibacter sp.]|uniref:Ig-like domain-containing protein n=1 Tax=uncultured Methanobrevibacter sp. TaxID=253161 RepID=UPI00258EA4C7|nr:Ig-like domain-containing protein [uncultured Methanobrevibacter sp.]
MLKSKILIISTMILFILSISAVNAENVTSSMVNDTVNNEFHVIDGKYLEYNNSENGKNLNDTSNVLYDGKDGSVLENKNSNDAIFKYGGNNTVVSKEKPKMNVIAEDSIIFGENLTVKVELPKDANPSWVLMSVGEIYYYVKIDDEGVSLWNMTGLEAGIQYIKIGYRGNNKYEAVEVFHTVNVIKANPNLNVFIKDVNYGENLTIYATLNGVNNTNLTGNVIVTINNKNYSVVVINGKGNVSADKLPAGLYNFSATWAGNDNYNGTNISGGFKINKIDSTIAINVEDIKVGENATIIVNLDSDATGNVTITLDNQNYTVAINEGQTIKVIGGLKAGTYDVFVKYIGDNNYNSAQNTTKFTVLKISDYNMDVTVPEFKEGVNSTVGVDLPKDAEGTVTVEIEGKKYTANIINGTAKVNIPGLGVGDYNITTTYSGDAKYVSMTKKGNITVIPNMDVNLYVDDVVMIYHDGTRLVAKLTDYQGRPIVNDIIYFTINGKTYAKTTDDNGTVSMGLNLDSKVYTATVSYNESEVYSKISKNVTVTINPTVISEDLVKMYQNDTRFYVKFTDSTGKALANTTVKFNIHGVFYTKKTDKDGVADLGIMLRPGEYILTAYNPVTGEEKGFNITVKSLIVQSDLTKYYLNASKFQATIYDKNGSLAVGKNVTFNINGVFYTKTTDSNGVVSLAINLRPGEYIITTMYEGLAVGNNIVVLPTLVTRDLNMTYGDGSNFTAQTLDGQGKPLPNQNVTFNINGVFYNKVTNDNGVASLTMRLMSGKYIITSYWNDFQTGNTIIIS